jgi:hypothetical protein
LTEARLQLTPSLTLSEAESKGKVFAFAVVFGGASRFNV